MLNNHSTQILCVLGASSLLMGAAAIHRLQQPAPQVPPPAAETAYTEALPVSPLPAFLVCEVDGLVAVFTGDGSELLQLTDSRVAMLPLGDRQRLAVGIPVADDRSLAMLLEDYQ